MRGRPKVPCRRAGRPLCRSGARGRRARRAGAPRAALNDERDREILYLRFGREMTQSDIGVELGISQMQVSRLLTRILARLRRGMLAT
ncbi:sigma-70 family RNA polymerase sigma factor [Streptomyces sp. ISL-94]|nr:sigma-70 family RNA polymerase sigma factor [Streptomyces sp. ISL-94]